MGEASRLGHGAQARRAWRGASTSNRSTRVRVRLVHRRGSLKRRREETYPVSCGALRPERRRVATCLATSRASTTPRGCTHPSTGSHRGSFARPLGGASTRNRSTRVRVRVRVRVRLVHRRGPLKQRRKETYPVSYARGAAARQPTSQAGMRPVRNSSGKSGLDATSCLNTVRTNKTTALSRR